MKSFKTTLEPLMPQSFIIAKERTDGTIYIAAGYTTTRVGSALSNFAFGLPYGRQNGINVRRHILAALKASANEAEFKQNIHKELNWINK